MVVGSPEGGRGEVEGGAVRGDPDDLRRELIETGTGSYRLAHALATRNGTDNRLRTSNGGSK